MRRLEFRSGVRLSSLVGRAVRRRSGRLVVRRGSEKLASSLLRGLRRLS